MMEPWQYNGEIHFLEEGSNPILISFGWTSDALLAGFKDTTRRAWNPEYVERMQAHGHFRDRCIMDAWSALPRVISKDPKKIGRIMLKADCVYSRDLPETDYAREGFEWLEAGGYTLGGIRPLRLWQSWQWIWNDGLRTGFDCAPSGNAAPLFIVRFNVVELTQAGRDRRDQLLQEGREVRPLAMVL